MRIAASILAALLARAAAFAPTHPPRPSKSGTASLQAAPSPDLVVISPPGGIGEIASLSAAQSGASVRWLVVGSSPRLELAADSLARIQKSGGAIELASADGKSLARPADGDDGAAAALGEWCVGARAVVCTYDGAEEEGRRAAKMDGGDAGGRELIRSGVRAAAREAASAAKDAVKVVALGSDEEADAVLGGGEKRGIFGLFGGGDDNVPETLVEAVGSANVVRYGELFGAPESSPESSPFVGGPRIDPTVRDMYTMRSIRIDPTISVSGNVLSSAGSKSNRLAVGSALARLGLSARLPARPVDVAVSSYPGTEAPTDDEWSAEFERAFAAVSSPSGGARLFSAEFASVPDVRRLAEWIAAKWAPAVLRSYDIAGIRVGARPVYALRASDDTVEVVWQELRDFETVTSGRMIVSINDRGMTASRGAGDASAGFGSVSKKPLPGEDVLVRRLADAAAQAVEKGLAVKSTAAAPAVVAKAVADEPAVVAETPKAAEPAPTQSSSDAGPRSSGVRRSSERTRGTRKRAASTSTEGDGSFE